MTQPYHLAVPGLDAYRPDSGIGRVLFSLRRAWAERVECHDAPLRTLNMPALRTLPFGLAAPAGSDLIFLPQLTGASALRSTRPLHSLVVVHDIGVVDCPEDAQAHDWFTRQVLQRHLNGLRFASHIVTVSHFTRTRLLEHLPQLEGKTSVIPNAVDDAFLDHCVEQGEAEAIIQKLTGIELQRPRLIYVGSETPRKNVGLLLEVLKNVQRYWPQAQLLKVGRAGQEADRARTLATMKALGLEAGKDVLFLQNIDDATLSCAYRSADLFVSASLYEGFGLPAAEALALGIPVITTDRGSFPEIVSRAGRLVPPDVLPFSDAVLEALAAPRRVQSSPNVMQSWQRSSEAYLELIERLVCA